MNRPSSFRGLATAFAAATVCTVVWVQPYRPGIVRGASMSPSMEDGSLYLLDRSERARNSVGRGDVIVFRMNGLIYVKRVWGMPGDCFNVMRTTDLDADMLLTDREATLLQRVRRRGRFCGERLVQRRVPEGCYYVVGDYYSRSEDSREWGPVPFSCVLGKVAYPACLPCGEYFAHALPAGLGARL